VNQEQETFVETGDLDPQDLLSRKVTINLKETRAPGTLPVNSTPPDRSSEDLVKEIAEMGKSLSTSGIERRTEEDRMSLLPVGGSWLSSSQGGNAFSWTISKC